MAELDASMMVWNLRVPSAGSVKLCSGVRISTTEGAKCVERVTRRQEEIGSSEILMFQASEHIEAKSMTQILEPSRVHNKLIKAKYEIWYGFAPIPRPMIASGLPRGQYVRKPQIVLKVHWESLRDNLVNDLPRLYYLRGFHSQFCLPSKPKG